TAAPVWSRVLRWIMGRFSWGTGKKKCLEKTMQGYGFLTVDRYRSNPRNLGCVEKREFILVK
ncbi:MAG: hypothetical protein U1E02_08260, partial [Hydrogenophaga sp.]|nr:hypothetical protein [Hydrogenophaga sp.]